MAKFKTAAEAKAIGAALFAAGRITGWTNYRQFGSHVLRIQVQGKRWFDLTAAEAAAVGTIASLKANIGVA
jgi:hypothetical protein